LDITHHSALNKHQIQEIERKANEIVRKNLPVYIQNFNRGAAEQNYGFRIYQGGVVPSNTVRIVNVGNEDIEACGGTHVSNTGEIGLIKILKTERIQDGVVRMEFVSGENALRYVQNQEDQLQHIVNALGTSREKVIESFSKNIEELDKTKKKLKSILRNISSVYVEQVKSNSKKMQPSSSQTPELRLYYIMDKDLDEEFHQNIGQEVSQSIPNIIYIAIINNANSAKVVVFCGETSSKILDAGSIAKFISSLLGGSGGGTARFGQGGGKSLQKLHDIEQEVKKMISEKIG
ncbi:MAG: DHHA1 domain-containing protein, partial [Thermoproteota archaeon]|nr:DHHA1 domain-containing protein [Thermoproteota archaeon]